MTFVAQNIKMSPRLLDGSSLGDHFSSCATFSSLKCLNSNCSARKYIHSAQRMNPNDSGELFTFPPLSSSGQDLVLYNKILLLDGCKTNIPDSLRSCGWRSMSNVSLKSQRDANVTV